LLFWPSTFFFPRRINGHLPHVDFQVADVTQLTLAPGSYDVVFSNWLLMYLSDQEVYNLACAAISWVRVAPWACGRVLCHIIMSMGDSLAALGGFWVCWLWAAWAHWDCLQAVGRLLQNPHHVFVASHWAGLHSMQFALSFLVQPPSCAPPPHNAML
jgi:hypothetical protein